MGRTSVTAFRDKQSRDRIAVGWGPAGPAGNQAASILRFVDEFPQCPRMMQHSIVAPFFRSATWADGRFAAVDRIAPG